jgi:hypothetical protein
MIELRPPRRGEEGLRALFGLQRDGRVRVTRFTARPLLQIAVLFDEYLDEVHLPLIPFRVQRVAFRALARAGRRCGYGALFPEYALGRTALAGDRVAGLDLRAEAPQCTDVSGGSQSASTNAVSHVSSGRASAA